MDGEQRVCSLLPGNSRSAVVDGCVVVAYEGRNRMRAVTVRSGEKLRTQHGEFLHDDWIGSHFGRKAFSTVRCGSKRRRQSEDGKEGDRNTDAAGNEDLKKDAGNSRRAWIYLLAPTSELWTRTLAHRTQVLYVADISLAIGRMGLKPGMHVLESGTGSGSMTHALARAIAPDGRVDSFEFHEARALAAQADIESHGLAGCVKVHVRDVQQDGFPVQEESRADAVFLDVPGPWETIPSLAKGLKEDATLCSFSPCIEQVQKTCAAMAAVGGFSDFRTFEVLLRQYDVFTHRTRPMDRDSNAEEVEGSKPSGVVSKPLMDARGHTGYLLFARRDLVQGDP
eukprot:jgi/Pico_ML_1/56007/g1608.t1